MDQKGRDFGFRSSGEEAATTLTAEIADSLDGLLRESGITNYTFALGCRSSAALVERVLAGSEDLALLNETYVSLSNLGTASPYFIQAVDILNSLAGGLL